MTITEQEARTARAGWFPDPREEHNLRYHDGEAWTDHVTHFGPTPCSGCHRPGAKS